MMAMRGAPSWSGRQCARLGVDARRPRAVRRDLRDRAVPRRLAAVSDRARLCVAFVWPLASAGMCGVSHRIAGIVTSWRLAAGAVDDGDGLAAGRRS